MGISFLRMEDAEKEKKNSTEQEQQSQLTSSINYNNSTSHFVRPRRNRSAKRATYLLPIIVVVNFLLLISAASAQHNNQKPIQSVDPHHPVSKNGSGDAPPPEMVITPEHLSVPLGGVIHLFPRYGYLSLSMRVIAKGEKILKGPPNASTTQNDSWIFLEPINNVIDPTTVRIEESSMSPSGQEDDPLPFHNLFHIDFCEDVSELIQAYFKNFSIEGLDKPWQAFGGGWRVQSISKYFGIHQGYVEGDYRFVLVKVLLVRGSGVVIPLPNVTVTEHYRQNILRFIPDNDLSTYEFLKVVGTHYVHAYIIGNAVYQVMVYDPDGFLAVKRRLLLDGVQHETTSDFMEELPEVLTMWVKHMGRVFVLNSSPPVADAVRNALEVHSNYNVPVINLFKLHNNPELVNEIERLLANESNAVLGIDLRGIQFLFKDPNQREGFEKALKHRLQLWEVNFQY